ncbi:MAG: efflux RND transporter periplasmic adaptor subunit [Anaerolineaceae bacterium]
MPIQSKSRFGIVLASVLILTVLAGCASTKASAQSGTGTVKDVTVTDTVESSGSIEPLQMAALAWGTSGTVQSINVKLGDKVTAGDVLLTLDPTTVPSSIILAESDLATAKLNLENLKASQTTTAEAQLALANAQTTYNDALGASYGSTIPHGTADQIAYYEAQIVIQQSKIDQLQKRYNGFSEASDTDPNKASAYSALLSAQMDLKTLELNLRYYQTSETKLQSSVTEAELAVAKAALDDAQRAYDRVKNGPTADDIAAAEAKVSAAQATVNNMSIIAPFSGELVVLNNQVGDAVNSGSQSAILVNRSKYYVDVLVDETQIASVKVGDTAVVTFAAINGLSIPGKVTSVDPIGASNSGVVNYTVRVTLDKTDPQILIGATANVVITVSQPQSMMTVPVLAVQNDAQGEYVVRVNNGSAERVSVVSGKIIGTEVVVKGDLKVGDTVEVTATSSTTTSTSSSNGNSSNFNRGGGGLFVP